MTTIIKHRRGTSTQWASSTYVLQLGELGYDSTVRKFKVGDGTSLWSALSFMHSLPSEIAELAQDALGSAFAAGTHSNITVTYDDSTNKISLATGPDVITQTSLTNTLTNATTGYVPIGDVGNADGVASLDSSGKVPDSEIPTAIARLASPTFTGTVTIPAGASISGFAPLASPSLTGTPLAPTATAGTNTTQLATTEFVGTAVSNLVSSAPATLNTLNELATALGNDASFSTTISTALGNKEPLLPSQSGNSGKYLTTDGSAKSWATISQYSLPTQTSNSGKFLTTNGTVESWATIPVTSAATRTTLGTVLGYTDVSSTDYNVAIGPNAGPITPSSSNVSNVSIGNYANGAITSGNSNTAIGTSSFAQNSEGIGNTGVGGWAGYNNTSGSYNVFLGHYAGTGNSSGSNNILIGNQASASSSSVSNQITLGNSSITTFRVPGLGVNWSTSAYGRATYASTSAPSGGNDGDVWLVYTA